MKRPHVVKGHRLGGLSAAILALALLGLHACNEEQAQQSSEIGPTAIDLPMLENDPITSENFLVHLIQTNENGLRLRLTNMSGAYVAAFLPVDLNYKIAKYVSQDSKNVMHLLVPTHEESKAVTIDEVWESVIQCEPIPADQSGGLVALKMELMLGVTTDQEGGVIVAEFPVKLQMANKMRLDNPLPRRESEIDP